MKSRITGFTIIEIVVVIALVGIASVVLVNLFIGQNRIYKTQTAELNVTGDARMALDDIDAYTRIAHRILNTHGSYTTNSETLILQVQSINSSNQLIAAAYDTVVFYKTGTNFYRQVFPNIASSRSAVTKKLAGNVTGLVISYNDPDPTLASQVTTDLTIAESAGQQTRSITASSKSFLRNY